MTEVSEPAAWDEGRRRREAFHAHGQALADMATEASMRAYAQSDERRTTQEGQRGVLGRQDPYQRGADVADREPVLGSDFGGQPLERLGGLINWSAVSDSPAPAMVDRRFIDRPGQRPTGMGSVKAYLDGQR
jgi:hypothetical protein